MTPDEKQLRAEIARKHAELENLKDDLRLMLEERKRMQRISVRPLGVDLSLLEDDGK